MPQQTAISPTCATCEKFNYHLEPTGKGWCTLFDKPARRNHTLTQDCVQQIETEQLKELLSTHNAFNKTISNILPEVDVYKQSPDYGYEKIGYVSENLVGWFALDRHGFTVAERLPSQNEALGALLESYEPVESEDYPSPLEQEPNQDFQTIEPEEDLPHAEFEVYPPIFCHFIDCQYVQKH